MGNALVEAGTVPVIGQDEEELLENLAVDIDQGLVESTDENDGSRKHVGMDDFHVLHLIGIGSFASVRLVRHKGNGKAYALKTLKKIMLVKRDKVLHTKTERWVLQHIDHPFLVRLRYAWQSPVKLYMVLDFLPGGELFYWLKKHKVFSEERARLIAAEVALGLEALHARDILYRDLKPENILLDGAGHIRIADFGLAKEGVKAPGRDGGARTFCGTPEYIAPEILIDGGHGFAVDWWSLGTLLYEMMAGLPPFYDTNLDFMYRKVLGAKLRFTRDFSDDAKNVLRGLLTRVPEERLGSQRGAAEILDQPFFSSLDRDAVLRKEYQPEFVPPNDDNFDSDLYDSLYSSPPDELGDSWREGPIFEGFTYDQSVIADDDSINGTY